MNASDPGVRERLIIGAVGHKYDGTCVFRYVSTVLIPIIDEQPDFQFSDQLGLIALGEINDRIADAVFLSQSQVTWWIL